MSALRKASIQAFTVAAKGNRTLIEGYYRLIDTPDKNAVTAENILQPHRQRTLRWMQAEKTVLCLHNGSSLSFRGKGSAGIVAWTDIRGLKLCATLVVSMRRGCRCESCGRNSTPCDRALTSRERTAADFGIAPPLLRISTECKSSLSWIWKWTTCSPSASSAIAINMVIAWRIHLMARFGRNAPGLPAGIPNSGYRSRSPHHDISGCRRTLGTRLAVREADSRFIGMPSRIFDD